MRRIFIWALIAVVIALGGGCSDRKTSMQQVPPRVAEAFKKTKTVCFGRFMLDVPETATVSWGPTDVPYRVEVEPGQAAQVASLAAKAEAAVKGEPRYPLTSGRTLFERTFPGPLAGQITVISQQNFDSDGMFRVESFLPVGPHAVRIESLPMGARMDIAIETTNSIGKRLVPRDEGAIPVVQGNCIESAFLPDAAPTGQDMSEFVSIGFRLAEFPDIHFSVSVRPANDDPRERLDVAIKKGDAALGELLSQIKVLRRGERNDTAWLVGYEDLLRFPREGEDVESHHQFRLKLPGVKGDVYRPIVDMQLQSGVQNNVAGAVRPSADDAEAMAIWNLLTKSVRVRPVQGGDVVGTVSGPDSPLPLGELAATGRNCPQTGWWQCADEGNVQGGRRQFFREGERMPHVVLLGKQSAWQKLKGEQPSYKTATVWKLVDYEHPAPASAPLAATNPETGAVEEVPPTAHKGNDGDDAEESASDKA